MNLTALVAFSGVFALGVIFSVLGSVKLKLASALKIDDSKIGALISALMLSSLVAVLLIGPLSDMLGYRVIALTGFSLGGVCLWWLACSKSYLSAFLSCMFLGVAAMCVNSVGNVMGPIILFEGSDPARASNLLNIAFCIGAIITPLIIVSALGNTGHKKPLIVIGTIIFLPVIYSLFAIFPEPEEGFAIIEALSLLGNSAVIISGLSLFCYISIEASMIGFITTFLRSHGLTEAKSGFFLGLFWVFLIISRLLYAFLFKEPGDPAVVIPVLSVMSIAAIAVMVYARSAVLAVFGVLFAGFSFGPVFPTVVGVAFVKTGAIALGNSGSVFGIVFAIGLLGGATVPALIGRYADKNGIRESLKIAMGVGVLLFIVSMALWLLVPVPSV